jgi:hypothetical protein
LRPLRLSLLAEALAKARRFNAFFPTPTLHRCTAITQKGYFKPLTNSLFLYHK